MSGFSCPPPLMPAPVVSTEAPIRNDGWGQRIAQVWVGIVVSYFVTNAAGALFGMHPFVSQAIGFLVAMVAFKGAPGFIAGCSAVLAELPGKLSERLLALIPRKDPK